MLNKKVLFTPQKIISSFLIIMILSSGCQKGEVDEPSQYWGSATFTWNGIPVSFNPYCFSDNIKLNIYLDGLNVHGGLEYSLVLGNLELKEYEVDSVVSYDNMGSNLKEYGSLYTFLGGDIIGNFYMLQNTDSNFVTIDSWDPITKELSGEFGLNFILDTLFQQHLPAIDTIQVRKGMFHVRIK